MNFRDYLRVVQAGEKLDSEAVEAPVQTLYLQRFEPGGRAAGLSPVAIMSYRLSGLLALDYLRRMIKCLSNVNDTEVNLREEEL